MRMATINQRAHLIVGSGAVDIEKASNGRFGPQPSDTVRLTPLLPASVFFCPTASLHLHFRIATAICIHHT